MNVGIGTETAQFLFWEYVNRIFGTVQSIIPGYRLGAVYDPDLLRAVCSLLSCEL
jgi:hypothetical protein